MILLRLIKGGRSLVGGLQNSHLTCLHIVLGGEVVSYPPWSQSVVCASPRKPATISAPRVLLSGAACPSCSGRTPPGFRLGTAFDAHQHL